MKGCAECESLSRRTFLSLLAGAGVGAVASPLVTTVGWAAPGYTGDVLVVLSLRGGFDGLSAVAPVADPAYQALRPTIAVPPSRTIALDTTFGMNVGLDGLKPLWNAGDLTFVPAAGIPQPNRSHFAAMDEVERAAPGTNIRSGWLDRLLGTWPASGAFDGVQIGYGMPIAFSGPFNEVSFQRVSEFALSGAWDDTERERLIAALTGMHDVAPALVKTPATTTLGALTAAAAMGEYTPSVTYPQTDLGQTLTEVAHIIKAGVGVRVVSIEEGGWDMHTDVGGPDDGGQMFNKLRDVGDSIAAFFADLGPSFTNGVTLVGLSEFGRRVEENESGGLDHGWGNVMIVAGGNVNGGQVHGTWLGLTDEGMLDGDVRVTTDYRAVLADILANRCDASAEVLTSVFPGFSGGHLGVTSP